MSRLQQTT